jgi:hypothetical protein
MKIHHKIWEWLKSLFVDRYEITIYFPGPVTEMPDGSKVHGANPKTFICKKKPVVSKDKCLFRFATLEKKVYKVETTSPVGYDIVKVK